MNSKNEFPKNRFGIRCSKEPVKKLDRGKHYSDGLCYFYYKKWGKRGLKCYAGSEGAYLREVEMITLARYIDIYEITRETWEEQISIAFRRLNPYRSGYVRRIFKITDK